MNDNNTYIKKVTLKEFNKKFNTVIYRNMSLYSVHKQLERVSNIECGFIAKSEERALESVLNSLDEYIINVDNVIYLCVREVEELKGANNE